MESHSSMFSTTAHFASHLLLTILFKFCPFRRIFTPINALTIDYFNGIEYIFDNYFTPVLTHTSDPDYDDDDDDDELTNEEFYELLHAVRTDSYPRFVAHGFNDSSVRGTDELWRPQRRGIPPIWELRPSSAFNL